MRNRHLGYSWVMALIFAAADTSVSTSAPAATGTTPVDCNDLSLLRSPEGGDVKQAVEKAISLFDKRKSNGFYSGGEQTDGGGNYNALTVDYRLAAIMKKIGYKNDSVHSWKWE